MHNYNFKNNKTLRRNPKYTIIIDLISDIITHMVDVFVIYKMQVSTENIK